MSEKQINEPQAKVINHDSGELLVVAGAGTGKTKTIVERIAALIEKGSKKQEILALTFTEKAAQEMLDRVSESLQESYGVEIPIHTFNAFGQLLIEEFAVEVGLSPSQKLVNEEGRVVFMRERIDQFNLKYFAFHSQPEGQLVALANYFSELKQQLITPENYATFVASMTTDDEADLLEKQKHKELSDAYAVYIATMREHNVIDYDDQIYLAVQLLENRPNIRKQLRQRFTHIMIDEFQDTNPMQSRLIDLIYGKDERENGSLVVVGDDDQAIYEWRGATLANILDFTKRYPYAEKVALITNYRSTQEILDSAWTLIQHNNPNRLESIEQLDKRLVAHKGSGHNPTVCEFESLDEELYYVAEEIKKIIKTNADKNEDQSVAVLARSKRLTKHMHDVLDTVGVMHSVAGLGEDLYSQPITILMLDALAAVWQPKQADRALYHTLVSRLFSLDTSVIIAAAHDARSTHISLFEILKKTNNEDIKKALAQIEDWHKDTTKLGVRELSYKILEESGLKEELYRTALSSAESAREIIHLSTWFQTLQDFEKITTTPSVFSYLDNLPVLKAEGENVDDTDQIIDDVPVVMTMHKAKGLEWDTVFVIGANERSFPYLGGGASLKIPDKLRHSSQADSKLYEERRLMYVAATRAKKQLVITHSRHVKGGKTLRKPSRFITEMKLESVQKDTGKVTNTLASPSEYEIPQQVSLPKKMIEDNTIILTASQADDYIQCPLNFYYKHVLNVPEISGPEAAVGSLFHEVIQCINDAKKNQTKMPSKDTLTKKISQHWPEMGYASRQQRETKLKEALKIFPSLYNRLVNEPIPLAVEESFRVLIPSSNVVLRGRFDAVVPYENGVEIHDYKTNTTVQDETKAKSKVSASKQLTMYAVAWRLMHGEKPETVALDFVMTGHIGRMKKMDKSLDSMEKTLAEIGKKIAAHEFEPGQKHDFCIHPT